MIEMPERRLKNNLLANRSAPFLYHNADGAGCQGRRSRAACSLYTEFGMVSPLPVPCKRSSDAPIPFGFGFQLLGHTVLLCPLSIGTLTHAVSISKAADTISIMVSSLNALSFFSVVLSFSGAAVKLLHLFLHDLLQEVLHGLRRVLDGGDVILRLFAQLVIAAFPEC